MATILLVDDEPAMRSVLRRVLERCGHEVTEAAGGYEAVKALSAAAYDLVITDVKMPGMGGLEVLRQVSELQPGVPAIAISGAADDFDAPRGVAVLMKPFPMDTFVSAVERALGEGDGGGEHGRVAGESAP
jgi:CheY-like chemotaxis protein